MKDHAIAYILKYIIILLYLQNQIIYMGNYKLCI